MGAMWLGGGAAGGAWRARALDLLRVARGLAAACTSWDRYISIIYLHMEYSMVYGPVKCMRAILDIFAPRADTLTHSIFSLCSPRHIHLVTCYLFLAHGLSAGGPALPR